jgi:hypothetical protein
MNIGGATAGDGATEPDGLLWPDAGTPERERLDRRNAALIAGLWEGFQRHRAALPVDTQP